MDKIKALKEMINNSNKIVFFGGAGVSTESGIKDFRSKDGLYNLKSKYGVPYETILSHTYFMYKTKTFYDFYKEFMITDAKPNEAHKYLAYLENIKDLTIITQNIDGLHQASGSHNVLELHGSIHRNYCMKCHTFYDLDTIKKAESIPICPICGGIIKPDVVLYEEGLDNNIIIKAIEAISNCDMLIVAGTSLNVYPAASFIDYFNGKYLVVINKEPLDKIKNASLVIEGKVGEIFKQLY